MKQSLEIIFNLRSLSQHENKWYHDSWYIGNESGFLKKWAYAGLF